MLKIVPKINMKPSEQDYPFIIYNGIFPSEFSECFVVKSLLMWFKTTLVPEMIGTLQIVATVHDHHNTQKGSKCQSTAEPGPGAGL